MAHPARDIWLNRLEKRAEFSLLNLEESSSYNSRYTACATLHVPMPWARGTGRSTRPDRNAQLRLALVELARQKPRYGYRRLHALPVRRDHPVSVMRIYRLYRAEGLAGLRLQRKRLSRVAVASHLVRSNQERALDFACDTLATGRGIRVLAVVDAFTRETLSREVDTGLSSRRVTRVLESAIERRRKPDAIRCDNGPELTSRHFLRWSRQVKRYKGRCIFWPAYLFTVIVGRTFAVILRVLRKCSGVGGRLRTRYQKCAPYRIAEQWPTSRYNTTSMNFGDNKIMARSVVFPMKQA